LLPYLKLCVEAAKQCARKCFCDGHVSAFAFFGGIPQSIVYDNAKIAVARILGDKTRISNFDTFRGLSKFGASRYHIRYWQSNIQSWDASLEKSVAIIPARGGSKRIPRKNIKPFCGKPALSWPISVAQESGLFDQIIVSTDDPEIAQIAQNIGATVLMRTPELSDDFTSSTDVIRDTVARTDLPPDTSVCCIYPTAFFLDQADLFLGHKKLLAGAKWVLTVGQYPTPIDRAYKRVGQSLVPRAPAMMSKRSQDLAPAFFDAGQFYWATAKTWLDAESHVWDGADGVELPLDRAVDIDTPADWHSAEKLFKLLMYTP
jgi:pseudaminic acid cytidylyltransferase